VQRSALPQNNWNEREGRAILTPALRASSTAYLISRPSYFPCRLLPGISDYLYESPGTQSPLSSGRFCFGEKLRRVERRGHVCLSGRITVLDEQMK
jgi:hypothetical protein